jgi:hypothetical protein
MPNEHRNVDRSRRRSAARAVIANRQRRPAVLTQEDSRNPLGHLRVGLGIRVQSVVRVVVRIDEAGRQYEAGSVDDAVVGARDR